MEEKNGKQVVRIGVVGENDDTSQQLIRAMVHVIEGQAKARALNFNTTPSTIHNIFKVAYKEIDLETRNYYYKIIYFPDFIPAIQHDQMLIEKSLMTGAGKPDVFVSAVYGEFGQGDVQFAYEISKLRLPLSGIFIHYDKPDPGEEEVNTDELEDMAKEAVGQFHFITGEPENYNFTDLELATSDSGWARPVDRFINKLDRTVGEHITIVEEDRRNNSSQKKNTKQIQTIAYLPSKTEGYDQPLEDGQQVDLEFESEKLKGAPYECGSAGGKFEDFRKSHDRFGGVQGIGFNLDKQEKIRLGDRFFIKVNGRIDGVGVVVDVT